jgi:uncharacterized phage protein (TIGR02218 family)
VKTASAALKAFIPSTRAFFEADLYTITPLGGSALRYTDCDRDITFGGNTYSSGGPLITRGSMKWSIGLVVDTLDLSIDIVPANLYLGRPLLQQLAIGALDGARFQLDRLFGSAFGSWVDSVTLFTGNIADIKELGRTHCKLVVRSRLELLNNSLPRLLFQPSCRWSLYSSGCTLSKAAFTTTYTVAAGSTALSLKSNAAQANGYYDLGTITYLTGLNAGVSATVKAYLLSSGAFTLNAPLPFAVTAGDTFAASAGCDKSSATCSGKFGNLINFGGQEFIPVPESAF